MRYFFAAMAMGMAALCLEGRAQPQLADGIEAIAHDSIITSYQVDLDADPLIEQLLQQYRNQPDVLQKKKADVEREALERLLQERLILHEFDTAGYNLPDSIIDEYVQERIRERFGGDRVRLIKTLQEEGMTFEQFRKRLRDQFIIEQMRLMRNSKDAIISPHKIEVYYLANTNAFKVEEQVKLRMIVLNKPTNDAGQTRKLADEILAKIDGGAGFAEMASVYSQGSQRSQGGDWGWVEKSVLRKELAEVAFKLQPRGRSGVIDTPEACYLMLVEERRPEHVKPLNEVRDEIEKTLLGREHERLQAQWIDRLKKKTFIRYF